MLIVQNMKIICSYFLNDKYFSNLIFNNYRMQGNDSRKYFHVSIDDIHDAENIFELLRDAVNFICKIILNWKFFHSYYFSLAVAYDRGDPVLVYSDRGVSRAAAVIVAFVSFQMRMNSQVNCHQIIYDIYYDFILSKL